MLKAMLQTAQNMTEAVRGMAQIYQQKHSGATGWPGHSATGSGHNEVGPGNNAAGSGHNKGGDVAVHPPCRGDGR